MAILHKYGKEIELPTFEDPLVRRALEDVKPPSRHTSTQRKPLTCRKSLTNFITSYRETPHYERGWNSQL
jgi:hypothetical protein